jgi:hypothetical protein
MRSKMRAASGRRLGWMRALLFALLVVVAIVGWVYLSSQTIERESSGPRMDLMPGFSSLRY